MKGLLVCLFGAMGAVSRYGLVLWLAERTSSLSPIWWINTLGSFAIGSLYAFRGHVGNLTYLAIATGFLGGFTTFSALSLEIFQFFEASRPLAGFAYGGMSLISGFLGACFGFWCVKVGLESFG